MKIQFQYILIPIFFWIYLPVIAQNPENPVSVELGEKTIDISEPFSLSVIVKQSEAAPKIIFPTIKGFQKRDQNIVRTEGNTNSEKKTITQTITQNYYPEKSGIFEILPLAVEVNGQQIKTEAISIVVVGDEGIVSLTIPTETSDAFLGLITDKNRVYIGEGFNARISFFVAESTLDMEFYKLDEQLDKILKAVRPANCWEESFKIREIPNFPITINGKKYVEYRIYQASYFPITSEAIGFPSFELTMKLNQEKAGKKSFTLEKFESKPVQITVIALPNTVNKSQLAVGDYQLNEKIIQKGGFYEYVFEIEGFGIINSNPNPLQNQSFFDIYPPLVSQNVSYLNNKVYTKRTLTYQLIPKEKGNFELSKLFYWAYFNPNSVQIDTLRSKIKVSVLDKNIQMSNAQAINNDPYGVYKDIQNVDSSESAIDYRGILKNFANVLLVLMILTMIYIIFKNGK